MRERPEDWKVKGVCAVCCCVRPLVAGRGRRVCLVCYLRGK